MATEGQTSLVMETQPKQEAQIQVDESGPGATYYVLAGISFIFIILFFPFSLLYTIKVIPLYIAHC